MGRLTLLDKEKQANQKILRSSPDPKNFKALLEKRKLQLAEEIKVELSKRNIKYSELAKKLGRVPSEITKWLSGKHNFTIESLFYIETILGFEIVSATPPQQEKAIKLIEIRNASINSTELDSIQQNEALRHVISNGVQVSPGKMNSSNNTGKNRSIKGFDETFFKPGLNEIEKFKNHQHTGVKELKFSSRLSSSYLLHQDGAIKVDQ